MTQYTPFEEDESSEPPGSYSDEAISRGPRHAQRASTNPRAPMMVGLGILLVTILAVVGWTWHEVRTLQSEALAAADPLKQIEPSPKALDADLKLLRTSSVHAKRARQAADSLPLRVAGRLPFIGDDVVAARTMATAMDNVVDQAGLPLVKLLDAMMNKPAGAPKAALINTDPLKTASPTITQAAEAVHTAHTELKGLDISKVDPKLSVPVAQATQMLAPLDEGLTQAHRYFPVVSDALGVNGPRDYLLVFQNLAEARPTGGIFGKWATISVDRSAISLRTIGANEDLTTLSLRSTPKMPQDFMAMYGQSIGPVANANLTPDFPSAAKVVLATWRQEGRPQPAGVISIDTKAIAGLLELTGPITVQGPDGPVVVAAENVVDVVQNRVYSWYEGKEKQRQIFLSALTSMVLGKLSDGNVPVRNLASTLQNLARNHEVMAYSTKASEQTGLENLGVSGQLPQPTPGRALVYLTDNGGSKMDHYLKVGMCSTPNRIGVRLTNALPADWQQSLPGYVLNQRKGADKGTNELTASIYLPAGRGMTRLTVDGKPTGAALGSEQGWSAVRVPLAIPAGDTRSLVLNLDGTAAAPRLTTQSLTQSVSDANDVCG